MTPDEATLRLVERLERQSRRTRPFILYGLFAIVLGFATLSLYLQRQKTELVNERDKLERLALDLTGKKDALERTLASARALAGRPASDAAARAELARTLQVASTEVGGLRAIAAQAMPDDRPPTVEATPAAIRQAREAPVNQTTLSSVRDLKVEGGARPLAHVRKVSRIIVRDSQQEDLALELRGLEHSRVSYHYLIDQSGGLHRLKNENDVAFHSTGANPDSIGIGVLHVSGKGDYTPAQVESLTSLIRDIAKRRGIDAAHVLSASDIDARRRSDFDQIRQRVVAGAF